MPPEDRSNQAEPEGACRRDWQLANEHGTIIEEAATPCRRKGVNAFEGTIRNGQIILDVPASLPEGTRVEVTPISHSRPTLGMREEDWPTTAEGIAALLANGPS